MASISRSRSRTQSSEREGNRELVTAVGSAFRSVQGAAPIQGSPTRRRPYAPSPITSYADYPVTHSIGHSALHRSIDTPLTLSPNRTYTSLSRVATPLPSSALSPPWVTVPRPMSAYPPPPLPRRPSFSPAVTAWPPQGPATRHGRLSYPSPGHRVRCMSAPSVERARLARDLYASETTYITHMLVEVEDSEVVDINALTTLAWSSTAQAKSGGVSPAARHVSQPQFQVPDPAPAPTAPVTGGEREAAPADPAPNTSPTPAEPTRTSVVVSEASASRLANIPEAARWVEVPQHYHSYVRYDGCCDPCGPYPVTQVVERQVPVPTVVERIVTVPEVYECQVPVEKLVERVVTVPVDRIIEVPVEQIREVEICCERLVPVERIVEKLVEVEKFIDRLVTVDRVVEIPVEVVREVPVMTMVEKIVDGPRGITREGPVQVTVETMVPREVEKRVEIPVEVIIERFVPRDVERLVEVPVERVVERLVTREVEKRVEVPVEKIVERIKEVPVLHTVEVPVERVVQKVVEVPVVVERIVEIPVERIVDRVVEVEVPRDMPIVVERFIEKIVHVPVEVERIVEIEKIIEIEKIVEVPVEVIVELERIVEVEKIVEIPVPIEKVREVVTETFMGPATVVEYEESRSVERSSVQSAAEGLGGRVEAISGSPFKTGFSTYSGTHAYGGTTSKGHTMGATGDVQRRLSLGESEGSWTSMVAAASGHSPTHPSKSATGAYDLGATVKAHGSTTGSSSVTGGYRSTGGGGYTTTSEYHSVTGKGTTGTHSAAADMGYLRSPYGAVAGAMRPSPVTKYPTSQAAEGYSMSSSSFSSSIETSPTLKSKTMNPYDSRYA